MRGNSQGSSSSVGMGGEKLGAFIKSLPRESREALARDVQGFQPAFHSVYPKTKQDGLVCLGTRELRNGKTVELTAPNVSDGMLRMIATCALRYAPGAGAGDPGPAPSAVGGFTVF